MNSLGIDIGGTEVKCALVEVDGSIERLIRIKFSSPPEKLFKQIYSAVKKFKFDKIGVAAAGDVDLKSGVLRFGPNIGWRNINIKKKFEELFQLPVIVQNDANAASYGAFILDLKGGCANMLCVTLGTGVGGGIIIGGKLYSGSSGSAGEIGHITYAHEGRLCGCGSKGCFEAYLGSSGILSLFKESSHKTARITRLNAPITPKKIFIAAKNGDIAAIKCWKKFGTILGVLSADLINIFNPDAIVFAGGVSKAAEFFLPAAKDEAKKRAYDSPFRKNRMLISLYQNVLGVVGAALVARSK